MKLLLLYLLLFFSIAVRSQKYGTFTDSRDNEVYKTVEIGNLIWMSENLRYNLPGSLENPENPDKKYGRLYNWKQAQEICPEGWTLPSDADWKSLERILGMALYDLDKRYYRGQSEGMALKSEKNWIRGAGNNSSGFNALPAGYYAAYNKSFRKFGESAVFWSSSGINGLYKTYRYLFADSSAIYRNESKKSYAYSCRCVKKELIENDSFFTDRRDGQVYKTIKIGNKLWMAENLRYYETAGTEIPEDKTGEYGMLYSWASLMSLDRKFSKSEWPQKTNHKGICPDGWHVPDMEEWNAILEEIDFDAEQLSSVSGWLNDKNGNNSSGFNAVPAGYFSAAYGLSNFGEAAYFWTSKNDKDEATSIKISYDFGAGTSSEKKSYRFSCRCVKD